VEESGRTTVTFENFVLRLPPPRVDRPGNIPIFTSDIYQVQFRVLWVRMHNLVTLESLGRLQALGVVRKISSRRNLSFESSPRNNKSQLVMFSYDQRLRGFTWPTGCSGTRVGVFQGRVISH
jgi:hypothetical protein